MTSLAFRYCSGAYTVRLPGYASFRPYPSCYERMILIGFVELHLVSNLLLGVIFARGLFDSLRSTKTCTEKLSDVTSHQLMIIPDSAVCTPVRGGDASQVVANGHSVYAAELLGALLQDLAGQSQSNAAYYTGRSADI